MEDRARFAPRGALRNLLRGAIGTKIALGDLLCAAHRRFRRNRGGGKTLRTVSKVAKN
jgi:hypothetical protein